MAERVTEYFVRKGWSIVSGLAKGCDTVAHETAVENGGHTVAVLPCGLHTIVPERNGKLAKRIVESGGALVTEYSFGEGPHPVYYIQRDRIQAGISRGVVMVQSEIEGGSIYASRAILRYGRILAVPRPHPEDIVLRAEEIEVNLILTGNDDTKKYNLLQDSKEGLNDRLKNLFVIKGSKDFDKLNRLLERTA